MRKSAEERFQQIGEDAVRQAEQVPCSKEDFAEGLKSIRDEVTQRLELLKSELVEDEDGS